MLVVSVLTPMFKSNISFCPHSTPSLIYIPIVKPTRYTSFTYLLILSNILHVSDGLCAHHQELKTVHTATGICQTATATFLVAGTKWNTSFPATKKVAVAVWHIPVAVCTVLTPDDGHKDRSKHVVYYSK